MRVLLPCRYKKFAACFVKLADAKDYLSRAQGMVASTPQSAGRKFEQRSCDDETALRSTADQPDPGACMNWLFDALTARGMRPKKAF